MKLKFLAALGFAATLYSCDDSTTGIGDFVAEGDQINAYADTYEVTSRTYRLDKLYSRTSSAYLGKYTDETFGPFSASFLTQINCPEGLEFPSTIKSIDSTTLELRYYGYFGDSLASLKVQVDELTTAIEDDGNNKSLYYTSLNPENYYDKNAAPLATQSYTAVDLSVSESERYKSDYYPRIAINLDKNKKDGKTFSQYLWEKYSENHDNFKDAHTFINNVLKGFYIHTTHGEGSIIYIGDILLNINFTYTKKDQKGQDSTAYGGYSFAASKEVFMSTHFDNEEGINEFMQKDDKKSTYLKTPAGLCTEIELPLDDIYDTRNQDTLNSVSLVLTKYKNVNKEESSNPYKMGTPKNLLLVRESEWTNFFEQNKTYDEQTSFLATYNETTKTYSFSKLNRLFSQLFSEKRSGQTPDNKLLVIPVTTELDATGNIIGVSHDMEVNSARLVGGENGEKLKLNIIYTKPELK